MARFLFHPLAVALGGAFAVLSAALPSQAQELVGATLGINPALYQINLANDALTPIASLPFETTALTDDGASLLAGTADGNIYQINAAGGAALYGSTGDSNPINGLALLNGSLYGLQEDASFNTDLFQYSLSGSALTDTFIGPVDDANLRAAQGLTVLNGQLVTADAGLGVGGYLFSLDPATAAESTLDTTGGASSGLLLNGLDSLAAEDGVLYAANNDPGTPDFAVYQVNPQTASVSNRVDLQGLPFGAIAPAIASIPEPSALWLLLPALGLTLAAARRRKPAVLGAAALLGMALVPGGAQAQTTSNPYAGPTGVLPTPPNNPQATATNPLNTGKSLTLPPLGVETNVGSLPLNLVSSPDGKYAVCSDMGFREYAVVVKTADGTEVSSLGFNGANPAYSASTSSLETNQEGLYYGLVFDPNKNNDGSYTLYAAQGNENTIAILNLSSAGLLSDTGMRFHGNTQPTLLPTALNNAIVAEKQLPSGTKLTFQQAFGVRPLDTPSGLVLDARGYLYAANNDTALPSLPASVSVYNTAANPPAEVGRYTFSTTPSATTVGTNYPFSIAALSDGSKIFVGSERDSAVYVLSASASTGGSPTNPTLIGSIATGSHPLGLTLSADQTKLYVANSQSDTVSVINTATDAVTANILLRPQGALSLPGVTPDALALSPDGKTLYAALADMNAVAEIDTTRNRLLGYLPVGWYPTALVASGSNNILVANAKGNYTRYPNPQYTSSFNPSVTSNGNEYDETMIEGDIQTIRVPTAAQLAQYTNMTLVNNKITPLTDNPSSNPLARIGLQAGKIKHVLYIVKENRTYDQILGDLTDASGNPLGNGDPSLDLDTPGNLITPNLHALAKRFVLLDNYFEGGEVSEDGWNWSNQGMANEFTVRNVPYNYSGREYFTQTVFQGQNNGYPVGGFPAGLSLLYPYGAPPVVDIAQNAGGYIWDDAQAYDLTYRNYGVDVSTGSAGVIPDNFPDHTGQIPGGHDTGGKTDYDFRRFDTNYPDSEAEYYYAYGQYPTVPAQGQKYTIPSTVQTSTAQNPNPQNALFAETQFGEANAPSRYSEFAREFNEMLVKDPTGGTVPAFMTMTLMSDHTQGLATGTAVHSPKSMVADDDFGVGQMVQLISNSPIWDSTAIFVIEDDSQDGPDHVDCHRSICYVISPWIKQSSVDHNFYNTDSVLHTMESLLGIPPMNQYDAIAPIINDWDTLPGNSPSYTAILPAANIIENLNPNEAQLAKLNHSSIEYKLAKLADKMDFTRPDASPEQLLNEMIWKSVKGWNSPVPAPVHKANFVAYTKAQKAAHADPDGDDDGH